MKITIDCDKDISSLHIVFTDGEASIIESDTESNIESKKSSPRKKPSKKSAPKEEFLNFDDTDVKIPENEVIVKPQIEDIKDRPVKVADSVNNETF